MGIHRLALHELTLDDIQRCELVMLCLERAHVLADAEECGDEVLEMRRERDEELGLGLALQRIGCAAGGGKARSQRRIGLAQCLDEASIERQQAVARVEVREGETVVECGWRFVEEQAAPRQFGCILPPEKGPASSQAGYILITRRSSFRPSAPV